MNKHVRQWLIDLIKINCQLNDISIVTDGLKLLLPVDIFETLIEKKYHSKEAYRVITQLNTHSLPITLY